MALEYVKHSSTWITIDRILLFSIILMLIVFFLPWFPGNILLQATPLPAHDMLLNVNNLEIDFLDSYNILRMIILVPLSALLLGLLVCFRTGVQKSVFLPISLLIIASISLMSFSYKATGGISGILVSLILLSGIGLYVRRIFRNNRLGQLSYIVVLLFACISVFLYQLDLSNTFYFKIETLHFSETYGFWITWVIFGILILALVMSSIKTFEDLGLIIGSIILSIIGYHAFTRPLFLSGPILFFADNLSIVGIHTTSHIQIVSIALVIAIFSGVPIGIYISRNQTAASIVLYIASIAITIPSIALFGFMMPILSSIDTAWDAVSGIGIGKVPAVIALALYSLLPIIRNTYIAIINIDPATIEAGRGMGMTQFQLLSHLQLPLAAPVIMAGVRTAVIMSIAIAAIAAYIGAGGLGLFVTEGLQMETNDSVITGAISMSLLAIVADILLGKTEKWITPAGLKVNLR